MNNYITINDFLISLLDYKPTLYYGENRVNARTEIFLQAADDYVSYIANVDKLELPQKTSRAISMEFSNAGESFLLDLYCYRDNRVIVGFNYKEDSSNQINYMTTTNEIMPFLDAFYELYVSQSKANLYYAYSKHDKKVLSTNEVQEASNALKSILKGNFTPNGVQDAVITNNQIKLVNDTAIFTLDLKIQQDAEISNFLFDRLEFPVLIEKEGEKLEPGNLMIPLYRLSDYPLLKDINVTTILTDIPLAGHTEIKEWFQEIADCPTLQSSEMKSIVNYHLINAKLATHVSQAKKLKI